MNRARVPLKLAATVVLVSSLGAVAAPGSRGVVHSTAKSVVTVGTVTTKDFRAVVVAQRMSGSPPTAEVRVGFARRVTGRWRELGEKRLDETYFWNSVTGPRAMCRLEIETVAPGRGSFRPAVTVRLLQSPSLGCGNTYRIPLVRR